METRYMIQIPCGCWLIWCWSDGEVCLKEISQSVLPKSLCIASWRSGKSYRRFDGNVCFLLYGRRDEKVVSLGLW